MDMKLRFILNVIVITWDYGKEITVTLTDALMSLESLRFMLGGAIKRPTATQNIIVRHTEEVVVDSTGKVPAPKDHLNPNYTYTPTGSVTHPIRLINLGGGIKPEGSSDPSTAGCRTQITSGTMSASGNTIKFKNPAAGIDSLTPPYPGDHIRIFWEETVTEARTDETAVEVTISPSTFPGTYRIIGDTFMRSEKTGADEPFQFIINKAKVASNVTITLEAEGDPSTFEMTLNVLRSTNDEGVNEMMKLVRYTLTDSVSGSNADDIGSLTAGSI